ncbi:exosome complex component MTR3-like [Ornithodoros turicata]|uniref:exosome complex component MTR3-like n=1 Tax=Ornithodoros turicata TaxID=34597 RepID=UPI0031392709
MSKDSRRICGPEGTRSYAPFQVINNKLPCNKPRRLDGRSNDQIRPLFMKTGVVSQAKGSAYLEVGKTKVVCSVYGPREIARRKDFTLRGQVNCDLRFAPYSCHIRRLPTSDNEALQYSQLLRDALTPVVCLYKFPKATIDVFVYVIENDGGVLAASITTAGLALADAGIDMYDVVIGCSVRQQGNSCLVDPTFREEAAAAPSDSEQSFGQMTLGFMPALQQVAALVQNGELDAASIVLNMKTLISSCHKIYPVVRDTLLSEIKSKMEDLLTEESDKDADMHPLPALGEQVA